MPEPSCNARRTLAVAGREPFVPVPLWALQKALVDHEARCAACRGVVNAGCVEPWYRSGLDKWIALAGGTPDA